MITMITTRRTLSIMITTFLSFLPFLPLACIFFALVCFTSCSQGPSNQEAKPLELSVRQRVSGTISQPGEVDWYHFKAVEANRILKVNCSSNTYRSDEELLITVYRVNEEGGKERLFAEHAPEGSEIPADITMNISIDIPKDIYISVRDLMDDEASNNPYYLTVDFTEDAEGNDNFSQATPLIVNNTESCQTDCISSIGDVDCYKFTAPGNGVYAILVDFTPFSGGTEVELSIDLYDSQGNLIESLTHGQGNTYHLLPCLSAGEYYVLIKEYGMDDFDLASTYRICLESAAADEQGANDTRSNASSLEYDDTSRTFSTCGSLDYSKDQDWYRFSLNDIPGQGCKVLAVSFDDEGQALSFTYQLTLEYAGGNDSESEEAGDGDPETGDSGGKVLLSHSYRGGSSVYQNEIKASDGDYYLLIQAAQGQNITQSAPYQVSLKVLDVIDPAEQTVKIIDPDSVPVKTAIGNDTIDTADLLVSDTLTTAMIGYRGDEDWYRIEVTDTSSHPDAVLEVFLDTNSLPSSVNYSLSIMQDEVIRRVFDKSAEGGPCELKTSLLVPASESPTPLSYFFRVCDYQGDNGDGLTPYRIQANIREIPKTLPQDPAIDQNMVIYYNETKEIGDNSAALVKLDYTSLTKKEYRVNTSLLNFLDQNQVSEARMIYDPNRTTGIIMEDADDQTTITFPWIAGYIDFQGDQDWFQIDMSPLSDGNQPASNWYYDISIDFHVAAPGSCVEYVWKFYRDWNQNGMCVDRPGDSDGFMASAGDLDTEIKPFDVTIPTEGTNQKFWVGDAWKGKFYLSVSDFNYVNSTHPDDDWGYTGAPYYFRITLKYHRGQSYP